MKIKRVFDVLFNEGLYTFKYLIRDNLNEKKSEESKYQNYIKKCEKVEKVTYRKETCSLGIIIWYGNSLKQNDTSNSIAISSENIMVYCMKEGDSLCDAVLKLDCDFVGFMSPGDIFDKNSYTIISRKLEENDDCICFYSDEDMMGTDGKRFNPVFKPDFSFDTIMSFNYIGGFFAVRTDKLSTLISEIKESGVVAEYMILLKIANVSNRSQILHINHVLLHRMKKQEYSEEMLAQIALFKKNILEGRMLENGLNGQAVVEKNEKYPVHYGYFKLENKPRISIIIPSKDNPNLMRTCLESLCKYTAFSRFEVIVVDNGSSDKHRREYNELFDELAIKVKYIYEPMIFNFSKMCNIGVENSSGELLLFLNDDIEIMPPRFKCKFQIDWLEAMAADALDKHTGAVGVKLLFPGSTLIQHTGIVNYESGAAHIFSKMDDENVYPAYRNVANYNYLCVTGACLMISREKFDLVGGFEERLAVTFNDVELCMKLYEAGFDNLVRNDIVLYHHESITRGEDVIDEEKFHRHLLEREKLFDMHPNLIRYDPYYSRLLNQKRLDYSISTSYYVNNAVDESDASMFKKYYNSSENIRGKIRSAVKRENLEIQGYIYIDGIKRGRNKFNPCIRISTKDRELYFDAVKIYDPTMSKYIGTKDNLNFASFYCCIDYKKIGLDDGSAYDITLCLRKGKKIYLSEIVKKC